MNTNYYYSNILVSTKNKPFLDVLQAHAEENKHQEGSGDGSLIRSIGIIRPSPNPTLDPSELAFAA